MTPINPQTLQIGNFANLWRDIFVKNKEGLFQGYKGLREKEILTADATRAIREQMEQSSPFAFVWLHFCWENIILPIFVLNGCELEGRYKILTNAAAEENFHAVIFDKKDGILFDPTYEKFSDTALVEGSACKGTDCMKVVLGTGCFFFDLSFYFDRFEVPGQRIIPQIKDAGKYFREWLSKNPDYRNILLARDRGAAGTPPSSGLPENN